MTRPTPEEFMAGHAVGLATLGWVRATVADLGEAEVTTSRSQVAFRRRRGFAYLWLPGQYLRRPLAEVVLSVVLGRADGSPRWKEVAHPRPQHWMHHLEVLDAGQLDDEVRAWLAEAYARA